MPSSANESSRQRWLERTLATIPVGMRILDAGAGELRNRRYCSHLQYVSQDFCEYHGATDANAPPGLHPPAWDISGIDIVSDITSIPEPDSSFDVILCSEVLEHVPEPTRALDEFARLLRQGGTLVLTAPFSSLVHFAPYHYCTGFSRYWYEHHLPLRGFRIRELESNGDWYAFLCQELGRLGPMQRSAGSLLWSIGYAYAAIGKTLIGMQGRRAQCDLGCFGFHCVAIKG